MIHDVLQPAHLSLGAYLEFGVHNCSSVYVSLYNSDLPNTASKTRSETSDTLDLTRLTFRPLSEATEPLPPVSLLSQIDHGEYTYFRQAGKDLVAIAAASLDSTKDHTIRITAPGTGDEAHTGMQFEGIWLSDGGSLTHPWDNPESPRRHMLAVTTSMLSHESEHHSRRSLKNEVIDQSRSGNTEDNVSRSVRLIPHKTIEIVSEAPRNPREQTKHESLGRLKGWQDWVGDMFGVDHVSIAVDEMCLASSCMSSRSQLASITDAFFRRLVEAIEG